MIKHNQDGAVSGVAVSLILTVVLLLGTIGFAAWAFSSREDYKNHTDAKISAAVDVAKKQESELKDRQFAEAAKNPLKTYNGPDALGSLVVQFPKTWSGYVDTGSGGQTLNGYFNPGVVPSVSSQGSAFALQVRVLSQSYPQILQNFTSQQQNGDVKVSAYALPKLPKVVGVKVVGKLSDRQTVGTMVVLPLRSQTVEIETDGTQYLNDFNTYILPNFSFSP